ncbi:MAG: hypothetical protein HFE64_05830 [Lachnospiraceae bacterium]|jgi:hypothetical protein|nr:hypothetical protein [Lachnospiraceae bacterium]
MRYQQAWLFIYFVILGAGGSLIYDGLRAVRRSIRHCVGAVLAEDGIFWIAAFAACYALFFLKNQGALRGYGFLGIVCGCILYFLLLSPIFLRIWCGIWKLLLFPVHKWQKYREKSRLRKQLKKEKTVDENQQIE